jgi:agmatinase
MIHGRAANQTSEVGQATGANLAKRGGHARFAACTGPAQAREYDVKTSASFFPFDLFGSGGTRAGAELLADGFREMLADNRREKVPTRARAYAGKVRLTEFTFDRPDDYQGWRDTARQAIHTAFDRGDFLLWVAGNHLGALPIFDELAGSDTLVIQFDAHLDIYHLSDCTEELSHGNFLKHCAGPLPRLVNVGHRDLLLRPDYVGAYFHRTFSAAELAIDPGAACTEIASLCAGASRVFLDLDCDVFDPAYFPGSAHPQPLGISPQLFLRVLDAAWSERVTGLAISEFDPARDVADRSLATLLWLMEYVLLRRYER